MENIQRTKPDDEINISGLLDSKSLTNFDNPYDMDLAIESVSSLVNFRLIFFLF